MDDKNKQIYEQYELEVDNVYKKRGFIYLESKDILYVVKPYNYTEKKAELECLVKRVLADRGFDLIDIMLKNNNQVYLTQNKYGNKFILKKWYRGEECDVTNIYDVEKVSRNLARLHKVSHGIRLDYAEAVIPCKNIIHEYENYNKELKRVRKYILKKKRKNELEIKILKYIDSYIQEAEYYYSKLKNCDYEKIYNEAIENNNICHGDYNHHSVIINNDMVCTVNFDKIAYGVCVYDLYSFLRKILEKNDWNDQLGINIIESYNDERELSLAEKEIIYIFLSYPDKFRKLVNSYYNGKKALVSARISEKLEELINGEVKKKEFLSIMKKRYNISI